MKSIMGSNKSSFFKKVFIKICRKLGYEIIDQNNFKIVTSNKKINDELSELGRSSINLYWKVASINSSFKILDVIVENTSYFVTKKSEFSKILRKNKGDLRKLIKELNKI